VGTALGVMGSILAWLVTPIGLVTVAIAALGAYLLYVSGAGGTRLRFTTGRILGHHQDRLQHRGDVQQPAYSLCRYDLRPLWRCRRDGDHHRWGVLTH
jgi:hypothetical protein